MELIKKVVSLIYQKRTDMKFLPIPRPIHRIPNQHGYKFYAVLENNKIVSAEVEKRKDGCHYIKGVSITQIAGWYSVDDVQSTKFN